LAPDRVVDEWWAGLVEYAARRRLSREERRAQLIDLGRRIAESSSFEALSTDEVADAAGISRSLLFHYFPTREHFLLAIAEQASAELLAVTDAPADLAPFERLRRALEAYVDYVVRQRDPYLALIRGQTGGSPEMQLLFERTRQVLADRILDGLGADPSAATPAVRLAARGYIAFVEEVVVTWLRADAVELSRAALLVLLEESALSVFAAAGFPVEGLDG
jgi:AcrR family transcriptional regulator